MTCPKCKSNQVSVIRSADRGQVVKRRRECLICHHRWNTVEVPEREYSMSTSLAEVLRSCVEEMEAVLNAL